MKVSVAWLQKYFAEPLPNTEKLVDTLTFHSSEVEGVDGEGENAVLDVKVLPDRAAYALSHRGIAYELAATLDRPLVSDPLREQLPTYEPSEKISISIENPEKCARYIAALVTGVKARPSPEWLVSALVSVGQRPINNVVDAANYVMLNIGQPIHTFDARKLTKDANGAYGIQVRGALDGEKITTLTGEEFTLPKDTIVITDQNANSLVGIAGIKGGKRAEVMNETTDLVVEVANFDGTSIRRASQAMKLWTDASLRFQNRISPELAAYGMRDVLALILEIAGGQVEGVVDEYPNPEEPQPSVHITREQLNGLLGTDFSMDEIASAVARLALTYGIEGEMVTVKPSFERRDIVIWQDLAEELGRILGYDRVTPAPLPAMKDMPDQAEWRGIEAIKDVLVEHGYTEISTPSFAADGDVLLANPLQQDRPYLRASLRGNMEDALSRAARESPRVLGPEPMLKLFELGTVFTKDDEHLSLSLGYQQLSGKPSAAVLAEAVDALLATFPSAGITAPENMEMSVAEMSLKDVDFAVMGAQTTPARYELGPYQPFSIYPFALRDIAVWTPLGTEESEVALLIQKTVGPLLVRTDLFDRFEKDDRISCAFRLVFQADDHTLTDLEIDPVMAEITGNLNGCEGFSVR